MAIRSVFTLGIAPLFGRVAFAQDDYRLSLRWTIPMLTPNPQNFSMILTFSMDGAGGCIAYHFTQYIGVEGELESCAGHWRRRRYGGTFDECKMTTFGAGSLGYVDPRMRHYVVASGKSLLKFMERHH